MGLTAKQLKASLDALGKIEPAFAAARARIGDPEPRIRERGYETLLRAIVGQQVSDQGGRLDPRQGRGGDRRHRRSGQGRRHQRRGPARRRPVAAEDRLCEEPRRGGALRPARFRAICPADDEEAIAALIRVKGIGRWSAEVYLLFAEGRADVWPAGDLAVQIEVGRILGLEARPTEKKVRELAEAWRPHRGAAAIFAWHHRHVVPV